jgi:AraC family transcriptional regulator
LARLARDFFPRHRGATIASHESAITNVLAVLRLDPCADWDLESMAKRAMMSRFHFSRVFKETTGISPERFLAALRIEQAKKLLLDTTTSVTSVCFGVGYRSLGTFTRLFAEFVGISPSGFRKLRTEFCSQNALGRLQSHFMRPAVNGPVTPLRGMLHLPAAFMGCAFVGLFESPIPERHPLSGALLLNGGGFELDASAAPPTAYLLAVGFPDLTDSMAFLLPPQKSILVASRRFEKQDLHPSRSYDLYPRALHIFDPPILVALPLLLELPTRRLAK